MNLEPNSRQDMDTASKSLQVTKLIHIALVMGVVMFGVVALSITSKAMTIKPDLSNPIILFAILVFFGNIGLSFLVPSIYRKMTPAPTTPALALQDYQKMCLVRWAFIEGAALFSAVVFFISKNSLPFYLFVVFVLFLASRYPSQEEFVEFEKGRKG